VIHTVREPLTWVRSRTKHADGMDMRPFAALMGTPMAAAGIPRWFLSKFPDLDRALPPRNEALDLGPPPQDHSSWGHYSAAIAFSAQNAFYRCITPSQQYLLLDASGGDLCSQAFLPKLAAFVNRTLPRLRMDSFSSRVHANSACDWACSSR